MRSNTRGNTSVDVLLSSEPVVESILSSEVVRVCQFIVIALMCQCIVLFGTVTNIISIICFMKIGFKDPVNVSLFGLSVSDLLSLLTLLLTLVCYNPYFEDLDLHFEPAELQYLVSGWPHIVFTRISSWITALITLERCLCITIPLKVKVIITPKRVAIIILSLYVVLLFCGSPMYFANGLGWKFSQERNRTILGLVFTSDRETFEGIAFVLNNVVLPYAAFIVVIICTVLLVTNLRSKSRWREKSIVAKQASAAGQRDQKVAKMVVVISSLFIVCFLPLCGVFIAVMCLPGFAVDGEYKNMAPIFGGVAIMFESINSASNIFIYYHMSSKYRAVLCRHFNLHLTVIVKENMQK